MYLSIAGYSLRRSGYIKWTIMQLFKCVNMDIMEKHKNVYGTIVEWKKDTKL